MTQMKLAALNEAARAEQPTTTRRGFGPLPCPLCGEWGTVSVSLAELTIGDGCHCQECDNDFGIEDVRARIAAWQRVLTWIDAAPALDA